MTNEERQEILEEIDTSGYEVSKWEADFLESVLSQEFPWTKKQISVIDRIIARYTGEE